MSAVCSKISCNSWLSILFDRVPVAIRAHQSAGPFHADLDFVKFLAMTFRAMTCRNSLGGMKGQRIASRNLIGDGIEDRLKIITIDGKITATGIIGDMRDVE